MSYNDEIISLKENASAAIIRLGRNARPTIMRGLRAATGVLAPAVKARMTTLLPSSRHTTSSGAFRGQKMVDAVWVKTDNNAMTVTTLLNRNTDARVDWFENGTTDRYKTRSRNLRRRSSGPMPTARGKITPLHFMRDTINAQTTHALNAFMKAVYASVEDAMK